MVQQSDNEEDKGGRYPRKSDKKVSFKVSDYIENEDEEDPYGQA